jgi:proteasome accessory factor PafA2
MAIPKVMGIETEYGIAGPGAVEFNPVLSSSFLINAYAGRYRRIRWDYEQESPLRDARGFEPVQERQPVEEDLGLANVVLPNGARYYVDHAHPEYSTPECATARDLVIHDKAGERILEASLEAAQRIMRDGERISIYKNNSDGKGNSYGCHENYLVARAVPFARIVRDLTPFFVTRQVFTGAGKLGAESGRAQGRGIRYQLSQRTDFFEAEVGLETTLKRPIINTRDEPHADPEKYRRLHCIVGDANLCEVSTFLKMGTTALILKMIEDETLPDLSLESPVAAMHEVSWDPSLRQTVRMRDGRRVRPVELQWEYLDHARRFVKDSDASASNAEVLQWWEAVLTGLDEDPMSMHRELDWVAKYRLLTAYADRGALSWTDPKLALIDLQYHDVRRSHGLYNRLAAGGKVQRLVTDQEVLAAIDEPPEDTRAYFRGKCIGRYQSQIAAASWDSIIFDTGRETLQRVPMREPLRGSKVHVEDLLEACEDAAALIDALQR